MLERPDAGEYDAFYATYVDKVPRGEILGLLEAEGERTAALLRTVPAEREAFRYAAGKWSLREVVGHILDTERVFSFRALSFARREPAALPGMDQDIWATASNAADRPLAELVRELVAVRQATLALFAGLDPASWLDRGTASGCEFSVRAIAWIIAGHELHHRGVIEARYLAQAG